MKIYRQSWNKLLAKFNLKIFFCFNYSFWKKINLVYFHCIKILNFLDNAFLHNPLPQKTTLSKAYKIYSFLIYLIKNNVKKTIEIIII